MAISRVLPNIAFISHALPRYCRRMLIVVMSYESNHLLYDYYNFPEEMYKVKFQSKGSPAVASRIVELLKQVCICPRSEINPRMGYLHGR